MSPLQITPVDAALHGLLSALQTATSEEPWGSTFVGRLLGTPGTFALMATRGALARAEPVGYVLVRSGGGEAEVLSIGVIEAARRSGVAQALMRAAIDRLRTAGVEALYLEVALDNTAALALYQRLGFRQVGHRPEYYRRPGGAIDAAILSLQLKEP